MDWTKIIQILSGVTTVVSLCAIFGALYLWLVSRSATKSLHDILIGEGVVDFNKAERILKAFKDDEARLKALLAILSHNDEQAKRIIKKVKANVDIGRLSLRQAEQWTHRLALAGVILFGLALIGGRFSQHAPSRDDTEIKQILSQLLELNRRFFEQQQKLIYFRMATVTNPPQALTESLQSETSRLRDSIKTTREVIQIYQKKSGSLPVEVQERMVVLEKAEALAANPLGFVWEDVSINSSTATTRSNAPAQLATLAGHTGKVLSMSFSPDGKLLATGAEDKTIRLWNTANWTLRVILRGYNSPVQCVGFSRDSRLLAWGGDGTEHLSIKVWDILKGQEKATLDLQVDHWPSRIYSIAFSSDNQMLAAGSSGPIRVWSLVNTQTMYTLPWQQTVPSYAYSVAFSPNDEMLAVGCHGGETTEVAESVRLWKWRAGPQGDTFIGGNDRALSLSHSDVRGVVAFSSDSKRLVRLTTGSSQKITNTRLRGRFGFEQETGSLKVWNFDHDMEKTSYDVPGGNAYSLAMLTNGNILVAAVAGPEGFGGFRRNGFDSNTNQNVLRLWDTEHRTRWNVDTGHRDSIVSVAMSANATTVATTGSDDNTVKVWDVRAAIQIASLKLKEDRDKLVALCERALKVMDDRLGNRPVDREISRKWYKEELQRHPEIHTVDELSGLLDIRADTSVRQFVDTLERIGSSQE